jgi:glycosyltransferase involved in cell wall biosynthesis
MAEADLFVMPSEFEAFGIVFIEALAAGVPVVGSAACAMPEIIQAPRFGRLLVDRDPASLATLILEALADDGLYARCQQASDGIAEQYSWQACAERMTQVIRAEVAQQRETGEGG